ncbi:MAG: prepilin peptidase [Rhodospirillales bacterium]|nr:prepilin peptidase [Rhodospirillales bacterium]MCB9994985.1 prepilin peptidase [Rhodospirillales bacterium]
MIFMVLFLFSVLVALGLGALAAWSDFKGMTIPNAIAAVVLAAFFVAFAAIHFAGVDAIFGSLKTHIIVGIVMLVITFGMFSARMIGGGDSKLVTAYAFWMQPYMLFTFLFYMMLFGAILGFFALIVKKAKPFKNAKEASWLYRLQKGEGVVPYGIPIALGAVIAFCDAGFVSPENLRLFLMSN